MTKTRTSKSIREDKLGITFVGVNKSSVVYARTCEKEFRPLTFSAYAFAAYMYIYIYTRHSLIRDRDASRTRPRLQRIEEIHFDGKQTENT